MPSELYFKVNDYVHISKFILTKYLCKLLNYIQRVDNMLFVRQSHTNGEDLAVIALYLHSTGRYFMEYVPTTLGILYCVKKQVNRTQYLLT